MLTIRLSRTGKKGQPSFRLILQDKRDPVKGRAKEILGNYLPAAKEKTAVLSRERIEYWISVGAKPSDSAAALLKKHGFKDVETFMEPRDKKRKKKGEESAKSETGGGAAKTEAKTETGTGIKAAPKEKTEKS